MEHHTTTSRAEAERLLGIAEKLLRSKDLGSCKDFAVLALETEPLLEGSEHILAVAQVLLAGEKRINKLHDWYAILQIGQRSDDSELIKKQYRRLALLLHPDKNNYAYADTAFRLVADAWAVLSDSGKKSAYDNEFSLFTKVDLAALKRQKDSQPQQQPQQTPPQQQQAANDLSQQKLPVRRSTRASNTANNNNNNNNNNDDDDDDDDDDGDDDNNNNNNDGGLNSGPVKKGNLDINVKKASNRGCRARMATNFWSVCPYCYMLYEYPRMYEGCCLKCQNCERAFTGMEVYSKPPTIPGTDTYHCCWGFFPMGFSLGDLDGEKSNDANGGFQNWMPPMFPSCNVDGEQANVAMPTEGVMHGAGIAPTAGAGAGFVAGGIAGFGVTSGTGVVVASGGGTSGAGRGRGNAAAKVPKEGAKKRGRPRKNP